MDTETMYMLNFAEHLGDALDNVGMMKELKTLYEFGKFYAENKGSESTNLELDQNALEAFKKAASIAYSLTHRLDSEDEDNDSWTK